MNEGLEVDLDPMDGLSYSPRDSILQIIPRWYWLVAFGLGGALIGWLAAGLMPGHLRATTRVMVDHNIEIALAERGLEDVHRYLNQETLKLEELAYSDQVWDQVERDLVGSSWNGAIPPREELQDQVLLPHPEDGVWSFVADGQDRERALALSESWASSFVSVVKASKDHAVDAQAQRVLADQLAAEMAEMEAECARTDAGAECPGAVERLRARREEVLQRVQDSSDVSLGISPYVNVFRLQEAPEVNEIGAKSGAWMLVGSSLGLLIGTLSAMAVPAQRMRGPGGEPA